MVIGYSEGAWLKLAFVEHLSRLSVSFAPKKRMGNHSHRVVLQVILGELRRGLRDLSFSLRQLAIRIVFRGPYRDLARQQRIQIAKRDVGLLYHVDYTQTAIMHNVC